MFWKFYIHVIFILIIVIVVGIIVIRYRRKYTRERYARTYLLTMTSLLLTVINVFTDNIYLRIFNAISQKLELGIQIDEDPTSFKDKLLISTLFVIVLIVGYKIFKHWNGPISTREKQDYGKRDFNIFIEAFFSFTKSGKEIYTKQKQIQKSVPSIKVQNDQEFWHVRAAKLIRLWDNQIYIDIKKDYYNQQHCYISKGGHEKKKIIGIGCYEYDIEKSEIQNLIKYIEGQIKQKSFQLIIAIEKSSSYRKSVVDGVEVEIIGKEYLLDNLIDLESYKSVVLREYAEKEVFPGCNFSLEKTYTQLACRQYKLKKEEEREIDSVEDYIFDWLNDNSRQEHLAILGEYGQGKTVLALRLAYLILNKKRETKRIPIIIKLGGIYPKGNIYKALLSSWSTSNKIDINALLELHYAGRLLLIFDGFDEMLLAGNYEMQKQCFNEIWKFNTPYSKIIITGRTNFFKNDAEMNSMLRFNTILESNHLCDVFELKKLDRKQIDQALRVLRSKKRKEILSAYDKSSNGSFADLVSRPSLLSITTFLWDEISQDKTINRSEDINSAFVINKYLQACYRREEKKDYKHEDNFILSKNERAYFMQGIAVAMANKSIFSNWIDYDNVKNYVMLLLASIPDEISMEDGLEPLMKRLQNRHGNNTVELILNDIRSCGILVREISNDNFRFAHKSFYELLVANYIACGILQKSISKQFDFIVYKAISNALEIDHDDMSRSPEITRFISEEINNKLDLSSKESIEEKNNYIYNSIRRYKISMKTSAMIVNMLSWCNESFRIIICSIITLSILYYTFCHLQFQDVINIYNVMLVCFMIFVIAFSFKLIISLVKMRKIGYKKKKGHENKIIYIYNNYNFAISVLQFFRFDILYSACYELGFEKQLLNSMSSRVSKLLKTCRLKDLISRGDMETWQEMTHKEMRRKGIEIILDTKELKMDVIQKDSQCES